MSKIAIHIISRTGRIHWLQEAWLRKHCLKADWIVTPYSVGMGRNASVVEFLQAGKEPFLLQLDDDIVLLPETESILGTDEALAYCTFPPRKSLPGIVQEIQPGCMRISREILEAMKPPWFEPLLDDTGSVQVRNEAWKLLEQARQMGIEPVRVGWAGHLVEVVAAYRGDLVSFAWPHEVRHEAPHRGAAQSRGAPDGKGSPG